jgi:LacI family transcriptional regulator
MTFNSTYQKFLSVKLERHSLSAWGFALLFGVLAIAVSGVSRDLGAERKNIHIADNGDGTFTNPIMPNAHWSDPCLLRVKDDFYCVTSSAETCPLMQILHSRDLVNWDVIGSVLRQWPDDLPSVMNWSPRISYVNGRFRVMFHITSLGFRVMEAEKPEGPWHYVKHNFTQMEGQWAANVFTDDDGTHYMIASNWIQRLSPDALSFEGDRIPVAHGNPLENPSLIKKDGIYYWFESQNGTCTPGNLPDKGKISVWRARHITGPYEGPHDLITGTNRFQSPNTGTAVLGPDNRWWYCYDVYDMLRLLDSFHSRVIVGAEEHFAAHDYNLMFLSLKYDAKVALQDLHMPVILQRWGLVCGYILAARVSPNLLDYLTHRGIAFAVLGKHVLGEWRNEQYDVVWFDDSQGTYDLTRYFLSLGHRDIWFIGNSRLPWSARRYEGYRRAMTQVGLPPQSSEIDSDDYFEVGYLATKSILNRHDPSTAILAGADLIAQGVYRALSDAGLQIPQDVSVAGFDDIEAAFFHPPVTTIAAYPEQTGKQLAQMLLNRIAHSEIPPQQYTIPTRLVKRESHRMLSVEGVPKTAV